MDISQLSSTEERKRKPLKRIGRGGTRGKTAGRGENGQKKRAGANIRPAARDMIKKIPKRRGYGKNRAKTVYTNRPRPVILNLSLVEENFEKGAEINPKVLLEKGLIEKKGGKLPNVKVLAGGVLEKSFSFSNCFASSAAKEKIEKAGGVIKM